MAADFVFTAAVVREDAAVLPTAVFFGAACLSAVSFSAVRLAAAFFGAAVRDAAIVAVRDPAFARPVSARDVPLPFDLVVLAAMIRASLLA